LVKNRKKGYNFCVAPMIVGMYPNPMGDMKISVKAVAIDTMLPNLLMKSLLIIVSVPEIIMRSGRIRM